MSVFIITHYAHKSGGAPKNQPPQLEKAEFSLVKAQSGIIRESEKSPPWKTNGEDHSLKCVQGHGVII